MERGTSETPERGPYVSHGLEPCSLIEPGFPSQAQSNPGHPVAKNKAFNDCNWNHRSVIEITSAAKSGGWFFHGLTGDEWTLTLKFRVKKNTFKRDELVSALDLKPWDGRVAGVGARHE